MRAPVLVFPRTRPPQQGQGYLDAGAAGSPDAFGLGVARGANALGAGLTDLAAQWQERTDRTEKFKALQGLSDARVEATTQLEALKRSVEPGVTDYVQQANEVVNKVQQKYLATVPGPLQEEMSYRASEAMRPLAAESMDFQYKQSDAYYIEGINTQYNRAKVLVGQDPTQFVSELRGLAESISTSDLQPDDKLKLAQDMTAGLSAVKYGKEYESIKRNPLVGVKNRHEAAAYGRAAEVQQKLINRGLTPTQAAAVAGRWIQESGAQSDGAAGDKGISHGYGQWNRERFDRLKSDAWRRPQDRGKDWRDPDLQIEFFMWELGNTEQAAGQRLRNATTADEAAQAMMDYERPQGWSPGNSRGGLGWENTLAATNKLSGAEATAAMDDDPVYRMLPYESRQAIRHDADAKIQQDVTAQMKARQAAEEAGRNTLFRNLMDGTAGETDIMAADKAGYLNDAAHYAQAQKLLAEKNKAIEGSTRIQSLLSGSGTPDFNPDNTDDKNAFNDYIGKPGLTALSQGDEAYVNTVLAPAVGKIHDIPTDVAGLLQGMTRSNDPKKALFALGVLAQLEGVDPKAYRDRTDGPTQDDVNFWRARKDNMLADQLLATLHGGTDPTMRKGVEALRKEAEDLLANKQDLTYNLSTLVDSFVGSGQFDLNWFGTATQGNVPWAAQSLGVEYQAAFIDAYTKYGNPEEANAAAQETLKRQWGVTALGGGDPVVMKFPPQKAGYAPVDGSYDWIDKEVRTTTPVGDMQYQLLSDERTKQQFVDWQQGNGPAPSYMIAVNDMANGGWQALTGPDGKPRRWNFSQAVAGGEEAFRNASPTVVQQGVEQVIPTAQPGSLQDMMR